MSGLMDHCAPLPPTAEQTSIARFNVLADQIRELSERLNNGHISVMDELERRMDGLQERQDQDREAISAWLSMFQSAFSTKFGTLEQRVGRSIEDILRVEKRFEIMERIVMAELIKVKRAVAKNGKAPLIRKKKGKR